MKRIIFFGFILLTTQLYAQLTISTEVRPRLEYRHGYKTLASDDVDAATFIAQRTRLNTHYEQDNLEVYLSLQDVRVWGDVPQLNSKDKNGLMVSQAWGKFNVGKYSAFKLGRQVIAYDDQRYFGSVGWATQGRSHDAALYMYNNSLFRLDIGLAYNQDNEALFGNELDVKNNYKSMQYVWLHKDWTNFQGSLLFVNNGWQYQDDQDSSENETRYNQTIGTHLNFKQNAFDIKANAYYQFGKDKLDNDLNAYLLGLAVDYNLTSDFKLGIGGEVISGNDNDEIVDEENNAFTPYFGTNHKFNGWMDYFYVGNHGNSVGLIDLQLNANYKIQNNTSIGMAVHNFSAAADFEEERLGTELDLVFNHQILKNVNLKCGYSHMFPSEGLEILKGNTDDNTNNWAWLMVTINPTLFTSKTN